MKRLVFIIATLTLCIVHCQSSTAFTEANEQYAAGNYADAATLYQQILSEQPSAVVYYNLGNAYFKQGELAQAILAYERSLRLDPSNKDARHNLRFAESRITDNISDNQAFFLSTFLTNVRNRLQQSTWTWLSIVAFALLMAGLLMFLLTAEPAMRKTGFSVAVVMLLVSLFAFFAARSLNRRDTAREEAVITQGVVNAKASPDRSGTELFTLHEGTKVRIEETLGEWCNISVGNYQGWILLNNLERI
ncbi:MAG: tetratricopeptide repeat protein [Paludibacteraceae bacterium]|nr:tetratricopeptide repeat protein [Paludibacteraceae bacterium]